jgi:hypothetical protein
LIILAGKDLIFLFYCLVLMFSFLSIYKPLHEGDLNKLKLLAVLFAFVELLLKHASLLST